MEKELRLKESRSELKRKLSTVSFEHSPIEYRKIKVEDLEAEKEQQELYKLWLDEERNEQKLPEKDYRRAHRKTTDSRLSLHPCTPSQRHDVSLAIELRS